MGRIILSILLTIFLSTPVLAEDLSDKTSSSDITGDDLFYRVQDPGGTPLDRKDTATERQTWMFTTPTLYGKLTANGTTTDDDDCTGEQGKMWYDTTDSTFEFCNANSGAPDSLAASAGDVTAVGPGCAGLACFNDGVTTTGTTLLVWEGTGDDANEFSIEVPENPGADVVITMPTSTGTLLLTDGAGTSLTAINGENIQDDTIDDDSIDFGDVTCFDITMTDCGTVTATGTITAADGFDCTGDVDCDIGSADIDDITFITDGIGTTEIVLPAGSIDGTEILDDTIDSADYAAGSIDTEHIAADQITNALIADDQIDSEHYVAGSIDPEHMASTFVGSVIWNAGGINVDGTECAAATAVQINSGPYTYSIICTDNDAATMYGHVIMPDGWDAGTVTFELEYVQTAADTNVLNADAACACRGATETVNNTWGTEVAIDDAAVTGSNAVDQTTSAAATCNGTCAAGDTLFWRIQVDATGTTTAVATLNFLGVKMEYTATPSD